MISTPAHAVGRQVIPLVWVDPATGLAIGGFDPVAYFTDGEARQGSGYFETVWGGASWRFTNVGNLEAFLAAPHLFAPRYGGYGTVGVSRRVLVPGNPLIWQIESNELYFFSSVIDREIWNMEREVLASDAATHWAQVMRETVEPRKTLNALADVLPGTPAPEPTEAGDMPDPIDY
ncbi:MAG: YHS domain-containing (seleno)protein [Pseudomonadota bacterium]